MVYVWYQSSKVDSETKITMMSIHVRLNETPFL